MSETNFVGRVKKHFGYLELDYKFIITKEHNSETHPRTDGVVQFTSDSTEIVIDSETGYASVWFYRIKDGKDFCLDPVAIHEYINTNRAEKELLLSTNPKDSSAASSLFNLKFLLNQPEWKIEDGTIEDKLEFRLMKYSAWLRQHDDDCLKGNFSKWPEFYEYKIQRARADLLRRGKDELVYTLIRDADGNSKLIKQSAFKDELEHIEKLKKEFS